MIRLDVIVLGAAAALAGCASQPQAPAGAGMGVAAPAEVPAQLAAEQRWLAQLFDGTPVTVGATNEGAVRLEVPLKYAFDNGRAAIKPPLNAVLEKVATSLLRQRRSRLQLAAPSIDRVDAMRAQMIARGIAAYRIERLPLRADAVELRLVEPPPPIDRLDDPPGTRR